MKKLLLLSLLFPSLVLAQSKTNKGTAYVGLMIHEDQIGGSVLLSYSPIPYIGIGAGVDITSYDEELMVPFYADIQGRYPVGKFVPFVNGQFGKQIYRKKDAVRYNDIGGNPIAGDDQIGQYFYGVGGGTSFRISKVGVFVRYTYRDYKFKMEGTTPENRPYKLITNQAANVITFGITL